ncbi:MAG: glycerol-3-phosphate dehydrogenase/oxidase [Pseudomonadota bacterium]
MGQREAHLSRVRNGTFDLIVLGGGVTGAGVARDAARRGLKVALLERADLASGTSSRSSKLVHGGLRYLEQYEFSLVFESVSERRVLMDIAPHLVRPLGFVFPVYKGSGLSPAIIDVGMWLYDGLSLFRSPKIHRRLSRKACAKEEPALSCEGLKSSELYYDCATDDARLTLETALDAAKAGAVVVTWCPAERLLHDQRGRIVGVEAHDVLGGERIQVRAHAVVNATGPWSDALRAEALGGQVKPLLRPTKGVHVVVDHARLPVRHAVVMTHPGDKRVLFAIPWGERTYLGTTDTDWDGDPAEIAADRADVDYLLGAAAHFFPAHLLSPEDVIATWAGLRPLINQAGVSESQVSREHHVEVEPNGMITIAGGKLTTYRRMAAEVVDRALDVLRLSGVALDQLHAAQTEREALPGAVGWPRDDDEGQLVGEIIRASGGRLSPEGASYLAESHGMLALDVAVLIASRPDLGEPLIPGRPEPLACVDWAVSRELAATLDDVLQRRTPLFFKDLDQGLGCAEQVADHMAALLGWSPARREAELARYRVEVARSRAWKSE